MKVPRVFTNPAPRRHVVGLFCGLIVLCAATHVAPAQSAISPGEFMTRMEAHWATVDDFSARFEQHIWEDDDARSLGYAGWIRSASPDPLRIDYSRGDGAFPAQPSQASESVVFNGTDWRHYDSAARRVTVGHEPETDVLLPLLVFSGALAMDRETFRERFTLRPIENEDIDGVRCYRVELMTRTSDRATRAYCTVWFRHDDLLPVRMSSRTALSRTDVALHEPRINTGLTPDALRLRVPRNVETLWR